MEKLQKCVNFIVTVPVFFCNQLYLGAAGDEIMM
jgi:hypothetical protein